MVAPTNTYDSNTDLSLGAVPQVEDRVLYEALLDIHNAIETLLTGSDAGDALITEFITKFRNVTAVNADYTVVATDGTIEVDASAGDITVTLRAAAADDQFGYRYDIKRVDLVTANTVIIVGNGTELIDGRVGGIKVSTKSSYTVKGNDTNDGWNII